MTGPAVTGTPRHPQWDQRLHALITANAGRPHAYGSWDCMQLAAATVEALTGTDHGRVHRNKYRAATGAARHLAKLGFASPEAMIDSMLEEKPIGFAQRGDLVLVPGEEGEWNIPAVCMGGFALFIATDGETHGLARVPRSAWLKAWSAGEPAGPSTPTRESLTAGPTVVTPTEAR